LLVNSSATRLLWSGERKVGFCLDNLRHRVRLLGRSSWQWFKKMWARLKSRIAAPSIFSVKVPASEIDPDYRIEDAWREHLAPTFRAAGFKGSGRHFRRIVNQFAECVSLQGSRHGGSFAINLGIQPLQIPDVMGNDVDPRKIDEISCEFRRRLSETTCDQWWSFTQLKSSKIIAAQDAATMFERFGLTYFSKMTGDDSPLMAINPISFEAGVFDFQGFRSTKVRMAHSLSLLRLASGDMRSSQDFAKIALNAMGSAVGLRSELMALAGVVS
jgi:Domain of unknown function (DUF4304)